MDVMHYTTHLWRCFWELKGVSYGAGKYFCQNMVSWHIRWRNELYYRQVWSKYITFNYKNGLFGGKYFICISKYIHEGNSRLCHQKYYWPCTKILGFVVCRFTSKNTSYPLYCTFLDDGKIIKSVKEVWYQQLCKRETYIFLYIWQYESGRIARTESDFNIDEILLRCVWDDDGEVFGHKLGKWGDGKIITDKTESIII